MLFLSETLRYTARLMEPEEEGAVQGEEERAVQGEEEGQCRGRRRGQCRGRENILTSGEMNQAY